MASETTEIPSFVSVLIISKQDSTYLLISDPVSNEYWIPSTKLEKKLDSWNAAVNSLLSEFQKQASISKSHKILKLLKVWQPCPFLPLYHVVYKIEISLEDKKKYTLKRNMSWITLEDLASPPIRDNLKSPELTHFIYYVNEKPVPFTVKPSPIISFPEELWDNMLSGDVVFELEEKHIVSESVKKDGVPVENIVDAAGITKQEQAALYREFLLHSFPCLFMSRKAFENFFSQFNGIIENVSNLFRTADIYSRNALSFKDFLHIIAVCESDASAAAEIRSRYIYRQ